MTRYFLIKLQPLYFLFAMRKFSHGEENLFSTRRESFLNAKRLRHVGDGKMLRHGKFSESPHGRLC